MPLFDKVGEELQEEGYHQQADVHAVNISIGSYNHFVIAQAVESVLNVEGSLQEVELFVFVDNLLGQSEAVERFATQREYGLRVDIAAFGN